MSFDKATDWRRYTADELGAQYSARAAVPEHPAIFERWRAVSAAYRESAAAEGRARLDLAFGSNPAELIDLFLPARGTGSAAPLHVFLHGGYWQAMGPRDFSFVAAGPNAAGEALAVLGYPLCPTVTMAALVDSVRNGFAWLLARAGELGLDPRDVTVSGHSAGGQLAALLAQADAADTTPGDASIGRVLTLSGVFELEPLIHTPLNDALRLDAAEARRLSPLLQPPAADVVLRAWIGGEESAEFHRQSAAMTAHWREAGGDAEWHDAAGCNHFTVLDALYAPDGDLVEASRSGDSRGDN